MISNLKRKMTAAAASAGAAVQLTPSVLADHTTAHNLTGGINQSVEGFVPIIVAMVLLSIAVGALYSLKKSRD